MSAADQTMPEGTDHIIEGAGVGEADERIGEETMFTPDENPDDANGAGGAEPAAPDAKDGQESNASASEAAPGKPGEGGTATTLFAAIDSWRTEGFDKARSYAQAGVDRTTEALDEVVQMVNDAADQIDGKLGSQYGGYARRAAEGIGGFGDMLKGKDVDQLFEDARAIVRKSPAVALGAAAALGFVVARMARAGAEAAESAAKSSGGKA